MKKYFFGLTALVMAIALSSFTARKFDNEKFFVLKSNVEETPTEAVLETESNWISVATQPGCESAVDPEIPCHILVSDDYYHQVGMTSSYELNVPGNNTGTLAVVAADVAVAAGQDQPELAIVVASDEGETSTIQTIRNQSID